MTETERSIAAAREHLAEARRWCRTKPEAAKHEMSVAVWEMLQPDEIVGSPLANRIARNLKEAMAFILACPAMAEGYIDGALFELAAFGDRLRRAREAEGRDAELAEAYTMKGEG